MKSLFLTICVAAVSLMAYANPFPKNNSEPLYTYSANESLKVMYGKVQNLTWSKAKGNLLRADFVLDDERLSAFFEENGNHVATTSEVTVEQLPAAARKAVKAKAKGATMLGLVQYSSDSETVYYMELSNGDKKTIYKVTGSGLVSKFI